MKLWSDSFTEGGLIPPQCAFAQIDGQRHMRHAGNRNPHLAWDDVPPGSESLVLFCRDLDAPAVGDNVNRPDRTVAADVPRVEFYHWTLVDIPLAIRGFNEGGLSAHVTPHGKPGPLLPFAVKNGTEHQLRHGLNNFTSWFAADPAMAGDYFGYDGPCPPWNDMRPHAYLFSLYALDVPRFALEGRFGGAEAHLAIRGHILDEAQVFGVYTLNPVVAAALGR